MSITNTQTETTGSSSAAPGEPEYDHAPEEVYEAVIKGDGTICQRCFRKQFAVAVVAIPTQTADTNGDLLNWVPVSDPEVGDASAFFEKFEPTDNIETCHPPRVEDPLDELDIPQSWKRATPPEQTVCKCGAVDDDGNRAPLSREEAVDYAKRISDRLNDAGVGHSRTHMLGAVERFKGISKISSRDDDIFLHAVRIAAEKHRGLPLRSIKIVEERGQIQIETKTAD